MFVGDSRRVRGLSYGGALIAEVTTGWRDGANGLPMLRSLDSARIARDEQRAKRREEQAEYDAAAYAAAAALRAGYSLWWRDGQEGGTFEYGGRMLSARGVFRRAGATTSELATACDEVAIEPTSFSQGGFVRLARPENEPGDEILPRKARENPVSFALASEGWCW
jgi:hypothetical protein